MKEEEVMNVNKIMEECLCSNVHAVCSSDKSRGDRNIFRETTVNNWNSQIREERKILHVTNKNYSHELKKNETTRMEGEENIP